MQRLAALVAVATLIGASPGAAACDVSALGDGAVALSGKGVAAAYRTVPASPPVGQPFAVEIVACRTDGSAPDEIRLDARMPAHGHGMNYTPARAAVAPGRARFDGLVFHMPGRWELVVDVHAGQERTRLTAPLAAGR